MTTHSEDAQHWREKYLAALDALQQQESSYQAQIEQMGRALVRVSLAAEGQDEPLDALLSQIRECVRKNKWHDLQNLSGQAERLVLQMEKQREQQQRQLRDTLGGLTRAWQALDLPEALARELAEYQQVAAHFNQPFSRLPALLGQLQTLQQQVLAQAQMTAAPEALPEGFLNQLRPLIASFIDTLEHNSPSLHESIQQLRAQLGAALTSARVLELLEQLRKLTLDACEQVTLAFTNYLDRVNRELLDISGLLGGALESSAAGQAASLALQEKVLQKVSHLEQHTAGATELGQLKAQVQVQLGGIRQTLDTLYQSHTSQKLVEQLNFLDRKVKIMEEEAEHSRASLEQQRRRALLDPLTQLPNREAYNQRAQIEIERWQRYGSALTLAIFDIDHFKRINDTLGHQAGDRVLQVIGRSIAKRLRELDFFCRYGGEEFVALLPDTSGDNAKRLMEQIRASIAALDLTYKEQPLKLSLSIGLTQFIAGDSLESAFDRADMALYEAKADGRNLVRGI